MKTAVISVAVLALLLVGPVAKLIAGGSGNNDWRTASRESAGIAPLPADHPAALVQVYAARTFSWRGALAVHTWISAKPSGADHYTVYEVIGWRSRNGGSALAIHRDLPDRHWYGAAPELLTQLSGDGIDDVIVRLDAAARAYPYGSSYRMWPGPNSNTFTAWVGRAVPELKLDLPPTAIGKDWLDNGGGEFFASVPSNTGYQVSLFGVLGLLVGIEEGIEISIATLTIGVDPLDLALKLPGFGRIGGIDSAHAE
jgi:hypothetical protein